MAISTTSAVFAKKGDTLDYTPAAAVSAGALTVVDGCVCLALWDIAKSEASTLKILHKGERITVTADDALGAQDAGTKLYVDSSGLITTTSTNNTLLGYAFTAITATAKTFDVICA